MGNSSELDKLRDVHLPPPLDWWSVAPGWYLLGFMIVIALASLGYLLHRYSIQGRPKRHALQLLAKYQRANANSQISCALISELLKRVALAYYPRSQVAKLQGQAWLDFLNSTGKGVDFNPVRTQLLERPYQPPHPDDLQNLYECARIWIKSNGSPIIDVPQLVRGTSSEGASPCLN